MRRYGCVLCLFFSIHAISAVADRGMPPCQILELPNYAQKIPCYTSQLVVVQALGKIRAKMDLCQRQGKTWHPVFKSSFEAVIGKNGIAAMGNKKEGDLKTPAGLYPIGEAFGTQALAVKMDYKYITADDKFIDDIHHEDYNRWVFGKTTATSYEPMLIGSYIYGAVINYNMNPVVKGAGSAIFIHVWLAAGLPTQGCIALEKNHVLQLLQWLDKAQHPYILIAESV